MRNLVACLLIMLLGFAGCKKDMLHLHKVQQLESHTDSRLNKIRFLNDSVCLIVGGERWQKSEMLRSVDGGYTFSNITNSDVQKGMYGFAQSPSGIIYLCGADGNVLYSRDAGASWHPKRVNEWRLFLSMVFPKEDSGMMIANIVQEYGTIYYVDSSLNIRSRQDFRFGLNQLYMTNANTGYAMGYGAVMKTTDCGANWAYQDATGDNFLCMDIHGDEIWMCGYNGGIFYTTNGGAAWKKLRNGNDFTLPQYHLNAIAFKDAVHGWAAGDGGVFIATDDAGQHWSEYERFTKEGLVSLAVCPNGDLLVSGENGALFRITP